jgi:PAT family beta-lactamase induction signal transducer AmpG
MHLLRDRRLLLLLALGFSAGVPLPLVAGQVLRQWFVESGMSLAELGLTALIGLAYANKFLWSPVLDAVRPPFLGRRRGWLLPIQLGLVAAIGAMALTDPREGAAVTVALAVLVAFLSASQDIVVDAWRIEMLGETRNARPGGSRPISGATARRCWPAARARCSWSAMSAGTGPTPMAPC